MFREKGYLDLAIIWEQRNGPTRPTSMDSTDHLWNFFWAATYITDLLSPDFLPSIIDWVFAAI